MPSDSTLYRTFRGVDPTTLTGLWDAMAETRSKVWRRSAATTGTATVVLDIDASLHQIHSENKQLAAPNYKGGYGFHPIYCFADATGETLAAVLRPGNAAANNIADHVAVLDQAIAGLPVEIAAGHHPGDEASFVTRAVQVRTDSAGCTGFVAHCRARNVGFAVVARSNRQIHTAISRVRHDDQAWTPARRQDGEPRTGAAVAELTHLVDLSDWPDRTRLIVRREPLHPGAQQSLFPSETYRYWGHYTDADGDPVDLDVHMRAHAHVEDNIRRLKDSGASRFPFTDIDANRAWLAVVAFADALVRWFQQLCLTGPLAAAEPKTLRSTLWLRVLWDQEAEAWSQWARLGLDVFHCEYNLPPFFEILPPPDGLLVVVGCGEGRVARALLERGYRVLGVDGSPLLARLASEGLDEAGSLPTAAADAAALPLCSGAADQIVAFMCLQDVDDLTGAVREIERVLQPGGVRCVAIMHPFDTAGGFDGESPDAAFRLRWPYPQPTRYEDPADLLGIRMVFGGWHRPVATYLNTFIRCGLAIDEVREPVPTDEVARMHPRLVRQQQIPAWLHLRVRKPVRIL